MLKSISPRGDWCSNSFNKMSQSSTLATTSRRPSLTNFDLLWFGPFFNGKSTLVGV